MNRIQDQDVIALATADTKSPKRNVGTRESKTAISLSDGCVGAIERVEGGKVCGWIYFGGQSSAASEVELLDGNEKIAVFVPDRMRADALDAGFANGSFGFAVELPERMFDGAEHSLRLCLPADGRIITGSQKRLRLTPRDADCDTNLVQGYFMGIRGILAEGWAYDSIYPDKPVTIEILDADRVIAVGLANTFREEPAAQGKDGAYIGFQIRIPNQYLDGRQLDLKARVADTTSYLPSSSQKLVKWAEDPGCVVTLSDIEDQFLVGQIELNIEEREQDLELELWIDGIWADRYTAKSPENDTGILPLRLPVPDKVRDGESWTSVFDGDVHEFVLTAADSSLLLANDDFKTILKTYTYDVLRHHHATELERLPRFIRRFVLRLIDSALFDTPFYSARVREEFISDVDAILHYLSDRKHWRYPTSPWLDVGFVKKLAEKSTRDNASPLEWYLRQGAASDVGPNPLFSNVDYCMLTGQKTDAIPKGASFFDDWLQLTSTHADAPNPSVLIDLDFIRATVDAESNCSGKHVLAYLKSWLQQNPRRRKVDTLSPYFDQDWLEQCFILKQNMPRGCLLSAYRTRQMVDQSPHPVVQCSREGKDYYTLIREYEILFFTSGIDDLSRVARSIDTDAFYAQFPQQKSNIKKSGPTRSSLYRYLMTDAMVTRKSFIRGLEDKFIENEYPGLLEYCAEKRGIADINRIWTRWIRLLGVPGNYRDSVNATSGLLTLQDIQGLRSHRSPRKDDLVRASFIIPTYGRDDLAIRCMLSALQSGDVSHIEFIVAEDAANVDAGWILGYFLPYATVYKNAKNLGFLLTCKEAVSRSSGKVLLLVNNDVIVHQNAVDEILATFERREDAAVVGGLVLNVDGSIQENAGVLWEDASAWNYHRNWKKEDEFALNTRQADYVSGCWLGIRRQVWDHLGGFDTRYAPAYYEETDFCLTCWRYGYRVYVNPHSEVTHLEGATMGQDEENPSTFKSFQKANRRNFQEKWKPLLSAMFNKNGDVTPFHTGRNDFKRYITLIFDHYIPEPDRDAGSRTMYVVCQAMAAMNDNYVLFVPANNNRSRYAAALERLGIEVITGAAGWKRFDDLLEKHSDLIEHVFISRIEVARKFQWHINKVDCSKSIYLHDIEALRCFQHDTNALGHNEIVKEAVSQYAKKNKELFAMFDNIISLSADETELLQPYFGKKIVDIFPYDFESAKRSGNIDERRDVLFVGSYNHMPNREAMANFIGSIWPSVKGKLLNARLHVCGAGFENANVFREQDVVLHGMVSDETLAYLYSICRVSIAPLLSGAGMKGKVVESCARGVLCVGTDVAWQGIELPQKYSFLKGTIASFGRRLIEAYHAHSEDTVQELTGLYESWREKNKVAVVIPRLISSDLFPGAHRDSVRSDL